VVTSPTESPSGTGKICSACSENAAAWKPLAHNCIETKIGAATVMQRVFRLMHGSGELRLVIGIIAHRLVANSHPWPQ
jgi:hypothetical protein